eukprot:CAMPEP_0194138626 /NCGR_PEP_ID=MMETSP0152-20130528/8375_1 /TAXON_ID=1049557 /ORGANISM="Thalassiothrix antarctica, Strain L6-D1" /LENGTH=272 /DNA_ID=CAMNT_0038836125 /DNA_START=46 /DNA_END=864 /DNA_ORIENTATION=-
MATTSLPDDKVVRQVIIKTLEEEEQKKQNSEGLKPNKLRKIVCKEIKETNWTQFQKVLNDLIQQNIVSQKKDNVFITPSTMKVNGGKRRERQGEETDENSVSEEEQQQKQVVMKIPIEIANHLNRKGGRKKKNIETNTKTQLTVVEKNKSVVELTILAKHDDDDNEKRNNDDGEDDDEDDQNEEDVIEKKLEKRIRVVKIIISSMIRSYTENPDHFVQSKAGGTLEEQQKSRKKRMERLMSARKKRKKGFNDADNDMEQQHSSEKKRTRKFY